MEASGGSRSLSPNTTQPLNSAQPPNRIRAEKVLPPAGGCGSITCNVITFEGVGNGGVIGTVNGTPDVSFGTTWLGLVDADAGGGGNFANEPSPDTISCFLSAADPIDFSLPVSFVEVCYSADSSSVPVSLTAYDGPGGTGNVVAIDYGTTIGQNQGGAPCVGDPEGNYCLWDLMTLTTPTPSIRSVILEGAVANYFGFDDMTFCTDGDTDGDGLLDKWEIRGVDINQDGAIDLDLPGMGADPFVSDIFVEVDTMIGRAPAYLGGVVSAFASHGITLHAMVDETDIPLAPWPSAWAGFDAVKAVRFGTAAERGDSNWANIGAARRQCFRYCVFADQIDGGSSSGMAEIGGNDFMVSLGHSSWPTPGGTPNQQAGTFMHELGHSLGLRHGGADDIQFKPNYRGVMNYTWQLPYPWSAGQLGLFYSETHLGTLDETSLDEPVGIGGSAGNITLAGPAPRRIVVESGPVDWDKDNDSAETGIPADINHIIGPASPNQVLVGHLDWAGMQFDLRDSTDFANGVHLNVTEAEMDGETNEEMTSTCPDPGSFCVAKVNSLGCSPAIRFTGSPTLAGDDDFLVDAWHMIGHQWGVCFGAGRKRRRPSGEERCASTSPRCSGRSSGRGAIREPARDPTRAT